MKQKQESESPGRLLLSGNPGNQEPPESAARSPGSREGGLELSSSGRNPTKERRGLGPRDGRDGGYRGDGGPRLERRGGNASLRREGRIETGIPS